MKKLIKNNYLIERWTIDRLDRDSGMTRIVCVPIKKEYLNENKIKKLLEIGNEDSGDQLKLWDLRKSQIKKMKISKLEKKLNLRDKETKIVSENMVFWILPSLDPDKPVKVFHKTGAARQLAKNLYERVLRNEGGSHETK